MLLEGLVVILPLVPALLLQWLPQIARLHGVYICHKELRQWIPGDEMGVTRSEQPLAFLFKRDSDRHFILVSFSLNTALVDG